MNNNLSIRISVAAAFVLVSAQALASCPTTYAALKAALDGAVEVESSGLNNPMWATVVDRNGTVCAVGFSGENRSRVWPGSRIINANEMDVLIRP